MTSPTPLCWPVVWDDGAYNVPSIYDHPLDSTHRPILVDITTWDDEVAVSFTVPGESGWDGCSHDEELDLTPAQLREVMRGVEWAEAALAAILADPRVIAYRQAFTDRKATA